MLSKDEMAELEEEVRIVFLARKRELSMSDDSIGKMAFPFMANPAGKVQALLVGQGAGDKRKPQQFRMGDVMNLCKALGLKWIDVQSSALKKIKR